MLLAVAGCQNGKIKRHLEGLAASSSLSGQKLLTYYQWQVFLFYCVVILSWQYGDSKEIAVHFVPDSCGVYQMRNLCELLWTVSPVEPQPHLMHSSCRVLCLSSVHISFLQPSVEPPVRHSCIKCVYCSSCQPCDSVGNSESGGFLEVFILIAVNIPQIIASMSS